MALTKIGPGAFPSGTVIQTVVHQEDGLTSFTASGTSDELLIASNAADSTSHISVTITPKFSNSKILLSTNIFFEGNNVLHSYLWAFHRDSTKLSQAAAGNRRVGIQVTGAGYYANDQDSTPDIATYQYYDSPNSTSAITYSASFVNNNSNAIIYLNKSKTDSDSVGYERGMSIITAQEIKV